MSPNITQDHAEVESSREQQDPDPHEASANYRKKRFGGFLLRRHQKLSEDERISLVRKGAWLGGTSWHVRDTASDPVDRTPHQLNIDDLTTEELAAAIKLRFVVRSIVPRARWDEALEVPEREIRSAALALMKKVRRED